MSSQLRGLQQEYTRGGPTRSHPAACMLLALACIAPWLSTSIAQLQSYNASAPLYLVPGLTRDGNGSGAWPPRPGQQLHGRVLAGRHQDGCTDASHGQLNAVRRVDPAAAAAHEAMSSFVHHACSCMCGCSGLPAHAVTSSCCLPIKGIYVGNTSGLPPAACLSYAPSCQPRQGRQHEPAGHALQTYLWVAMALQQYVAMSSTLSLMPSQSTARL